MLVIEEAGRPDGGVPAERARVRSRGRFTLSPRAYGRVANGALAALTLIVLTGAAVRLTGSGLGCPDWPRCYGGIIAPWELHAVIEYGNRLLSGVVGLAALAAGALAWRRRPFRRDLAAIGALLPLGVLAQAILGGLTVRYHLAPGFVMGHYALSMLILVAAVSLAWRARPGPAVEPGARPDRALVWVTRALLPWTAVTVVAGTAATAAGPHAGGAGTGDEVPRLMLRGQETLEWAIRGHARIAASLGIATLVVWLLARRRRADRGLRRWLSAMLALLGLQGALGTAQYLLGLPGPLVWIHVALATLTWLTMLATVAAAGYAKGRRAAAGAARRDVPAERGELEPARP